MAKDINSEEGQTMLLVAGKAFYWDKLVEKVGLGLLCSLINGEASIVESNEYRDNEK